MTRKFRLLTALSDSGVVLSLSACGADGDSSGDGGGADQPVHEWTMAGFQGPGTAQGLAIDWYMDELETRSDGRIVIEDRFHNGTLVDASEIAQAVRDGRVDLGNFSTAHTPAEFPVSGIAEVPFIDENVPAQVIALNQLYQDNSAFQSEWEDQGLHLLSYIGMPPPMIGAREPVSGVDWFQGKSVRSSGAVTLAVEAMGGNPVSLQTAEAYEAMERGVVDGYSGIFLDVITALSLHEIGPYIADFGMGYFASSSWGMSQSAWEDLEPDLQDIMTELNEDFVAQHIEFRNQAEDESCDIILEAGGEVTVWDDSEISRLHDLVADDAHAAFADSMSSAGVDGEALLADYENLVADAASENSDYVTGARRCADR